MRNDCCQKPEEEPVLETIDNDKKEIDKKEFDKKEIDKKKDKYPHDSDPCFRSYKSGSKKSDIKPIPTENIIEE